MPDSRDRDTSVAPTKVSRTPEEAEALIRRLDADREAIMRGRVFTDAEDSVEVLRQMREERMAQLTGP
jgi:hypothetical protein